VRSELTGPDPFDLPAPATAPLVVVSAEEYRLTRYLVLHRRWCPCTRKQPGPPRRWHHALGARDLRHLLEQVWPHDTPPGFAVRDLAGRVALAACRPLLPIHPYHRTLMKEQNTMDKVTVLACPDATGKFIVHDPACGHPARLRAAKNGTGQHRTVASLPELVRDLYPANTLEAEGLDVIVERDFEVRDCTPLPVEEPAEESFEDRVAKAVLASYSALVALATTADTVDGLCARELTLRLEQRHATTSVARRASANLTTGDVRAHLVASSECAAWVGVRAGAEVDLPQDATDMDRAKRWVATARAMVRRFDEQWRRSMEDGGTAMGRAFKEAEEEGRRRFVNHATDALQPVADLMEPRGSW
jgi:hypothetical protein